MSCIEVYFWQEMCSSFFVVCDISLCLEMFETRELLNSVLLCLAKLEYLRESVVLCSLPTSVPPQR